MDNVQRTLDYRLFIAVVENELAQAEEMLTSGANPNGDSGIGYCMLHVAAEKGFCDMARLLLRHSADIEGRSSMATHGQGPLHVACEHGQKDMAALLMEHGANLQSRDNYGRAPLALCKCANTAGLLLDAGADIHATDIFGMQAIHHAAATNAEILFLLIARGADVDALANDGDRPLHFAALHGKAANIDLLLAAGANAGARNDFGATPAEVNEDAATRNAFANGPSQEAIEKIRAIFPSPHEEAKRHLRKWRGRRPHGPSLCRKRLPTPKF